MNLVLVTIGGADIAKRRESIVGLNKRFKYQLQENVHYGSARLVGLIGDLYKRFKVRA
jgi:hypothetical protein